jgi:pSer/pThr/pTyr-binding forkhead associated (FHA) protein
MVRDLLIYHLDGTVRSYPLKGHTRLTLGRSLDADLAYPDDSILSRKHVAIEREGDDWYVVELGSKNGTTLNGEKLGEGERRKLSLGDRVAAGRVTIVYDDPKEQAEQTVLFVPEPETGAAARMTTNLDEVVGTGADALSSRMIANSPRMQALIEAGRELDANRPLPEVFSKVLDLAVNAVHARRGVVLTMDSGTLTMRAAKGDNFRISRAVRDRVVESKESLLIIDTAQDAGLKGSETIMQQNVRSLMAVPLQTRDTVIGLLYVDAQNQLRTFSPDDLNVLTVLANVAAIRVEHTRLGEVEAHDRFLQRELDQAAEIQRNLLPKHAPSVKGLELAGVSLPCRSVGGDYFDYLKMAGGRIGIICGDVAGKGMAAALMMSSVQARAQMLCEETMNLGTFMTRLNRSVCASCPGNRFITFFMCIFHPESGDFV